MATKKSSSGLPGLKGLINSPGFGKAFKAGLILLIVAAASYGGYLLLKEKPSEAASSAKYGPWYYNSKGIKHQAGIKESAKGLFSGYIQGFGLPGLAKAPLGGAKGTVWLSDSNRFYGGLGSPANFYVWDGPSVHLPAGKQYLGCFAYQTGALNYGGEAEGLTLLDVYNSKPKKVYNKYWVSDYTKLISGYSPQKFGYENITNQTRSKGAFTKTCLAFYVPKSAKHNRISLRVKLLKGQVGVRWTKITEVPSKNNELPNSRFLKRPDNSTIIQGGHYK